MAYLSSPSLPPLILGDFSLLYSELQKIPNLPCLTCPFIRVLEDGKPICSVYSHQFIGLESCKEIANFIKEHGSKPLLEDQRIVFSQEDIIGKV